MGSLKPSHLEAHGILILVVQASAGNLGSSLPFRGMLLLEHLRERTCKWKCLLCAFVSKQSRQGGDCSDAEPHLVARVEQREKHEVHEYVVLVEAIE